MNKYLEAAELWSEPREGYPCDASVSQEDLDAAHKLARLVTDLGAMLTPDVKRAAEKVSSVRSSNPCYSDLQGVEYQSAEYQLTKFALTVIAKLREGT